VGVGQVLQPGRRRVVVAHQHVGQPGGQEMILDGVEPGRRFGMAGAHVVASAIGMAEERGGHRRTLRCGFAVMSRSLGSLVLISLKPARAHALSAVRLSSLS
jgi:hypothetical protein